MIRIHASFPDIIGWQPFWNVFLAKHPSSNRPRCLKTFRTGKFRPVPLPTSYVLFSFTLSKKSESFFFLFAPFTFSNNNLGRLINIGGS